MKARNLLLMTGIAASTSIVAQEIVETQTTDSMKTEKKENVAVQAYKATENAVVNGYKAVESAVVKGYKAVESTVVKGWEAVENGCVKMFTYDGETTEETKERLRAGAERLQTISEQAQQRSREISEQAQQRSREISEKATGKHD